MVTTITITERGNLTLPARLRKEAGIKPNDLLTVELMAGGGLALRPAMAVPIEIYSDERLAEFEEAEHELGKLMQARGFKS